MLPGEGLTSRLPFIVTVAFLVGVALFGGASRADAWAQLPVRLISIIVIAISFSAARARRDDVGGLGWAFLAGAAGLIAVQLVPLPPAIWSMLPGREPYVRFLSGLGVPAQWRPLSFTPDLTLNALFALIPAIAAYCCATWNGAVGQRRILRAIIVLLALGAVLGLVQDLAGPSSRLRYYSVTSREAAVGLFANRNHHALTMAIGISLLIWEISHWEERPARSGRAMIAAMMFFVFFASALASGSRSGMLLILIALVSSIALNRRLLFNLREQVVTRTWLAAIATVSVVGLVVAFMMSGRAESLRRLSQLDFGSDPRSKLLAAFPEMIRAYFPFGAGFGSFADQYRKFETFDALSLVYINEAHNEFAQLLIEGGVFGLLLLLGYCGWWIRSTWRFAVSPSQREGMELGRLGAIVTGLFLIASLTDYPLRTPLAMSIFVFASYWMLFPIPSYRPSDTAPDGSHFTGQPSPTRRAASRNFGNV